MSTHGAREHARWSASSSARNFACPGALALIEKMGFVDKESRAAAWGTVCHQVAEICLHDGKDAADFVGSTVTAKDFSFEFDDEMAETTQVFLDYVRGRMEEYEQTARDDANPHETSPATLLIEQKFDLAPLNPPFEAGGTGDAVMLFPAWGLIEVVDLKTGRGWVDAVGNPQTRTYALGAALANPGAWSAVKSTIVQPRASGDPIRSETIDVIDLMDWTTDLIAAMNDCGEAMAMLECVGGVVFGSLDTEEEWAAGYLRPGDHCHDTYCPAAKACPALEARALAAARTLLQPIADGEFAVPTPPEPRTLPIEKIVAVLDAADMIEGWLNSVRAYARELVEGGVPVGNYILVDKQARRKWKDADAPANVAAEISKTTHISTSACFTEPVLKSPAQIDALVGKTGAKLITDLWTKESSGTNLVRSDKTTRPAALPASQKFFQPINEE
jgi:hypothetical protein